jgi:hypothetical protein
MALVQSTNHVYTPLSQPTEIRIAIIEPSMKYDAPLRFTFRQTPLEDLEGRYEAVSYVWGLPILEYLVYHTTDDSQINVTHNLDGALRRLRHKVDQRWLWADAMCISQRNDQEKAVQIPLMVDVFRGSKRVLAWLHQGDESIERGLRVLDRLSRGPRWKRATKDYNEPIADEKDHALKFLTQPFFRRLWIIQEVVFSLDITFICGQTELSWLRLSTALMSDRYKSLGIEEETQYNTGSIQEMALLWRQNCIDSNQQGLESNPPRHILYLVLESTAFACSEPRDRVFALHSISNDINAGVVIDYTLNLQTTCRNFAFFCMKSGRCDIILQAALAQVGRHAPTTWPSWVPDWRLNDTITWNYLPECIVRDMQNDVIIVDINRRGPSSGLTWPDG